MNGKSLEAALRKPDMREIVTVKGLLMEPLPCFSLGGTENRRGSRWLQWDRLTSLCRTKEAAETQESP
jgi:hypothetical protein